MNKSQLRRLAAQAADARISRDEYRTRRRELLDNLVAGIESIDRTQAPQADDEESTSLNGEHKGAASLERRPQPRGRLPLLLAAGLALCAAVLGALLWPEAPPPIATRAAPSMPQTQEIPRSRALVESFLARRDFDPESIDDFRRDWQQVDASDRQRALDELWFGSMVRALRDEITTQKALAGLTSGNTAMERAKLAFALGEFLGVSNKLPRIDDIADRLAEPSADHAASGPETVVPASIEGESAEAPISAADDAQSLAATTEPTIAAVPTPPPAPATAAPPAVEPSASQWLVSQADEQLSVRTVATDGLDGVEPLLAARAEAPSHILPSKDAAPRQRILYGVFDEQARTSGADTRLPAAITKASQGANKNSLPVAPDDVPAPASTPEPGQEPAPAPATAASDVFTLQVLASTNRDNAQALIDAFPSLKLQMREIAASATPYRVVYGGYASAAEARTAALALPKALLARLGTPLPKSIRSLGSASSQ